MTLLCCLLTFTAYPGGFEINEHSSRAMAMGGAFTAVANDASAIYFNAAGLNQLKGFHLLTGTTMLVPSFSFIGVAPDVKKYEGKTQYFFPVHFYASYAVNDDLSFGLGFTSPFGLGTKWDENWVGKYMAVETLVEVFTVTPVVAYKVLNNLSVSAGLIYSFADVTMTRKAPQGTFAGDAFIKLKGNDKSAFGYTFGLLYKPLDYLTLGASFHSQIKYNFKGTAESNGAPQLASKLPHGNIQANITTPMYINIGAALKVNNNLTLSTEFQYVGWSSYDTLQVNFEDGSKSANPRLYKDAYIIRLGGEYVFENGISVLAGIYYDQLPVESKMMNPTLPEANRIGSSFGLGYKINDNFTINASYLYVYSKSITVDNSEETYTSGNAPFNGIFKAGANVAALSLSYNF
jgi:long-chain fatty acid transport protein